MNIVNQISDLFFENECVIIPGFGGFLSRYSSAKINNSTRSILPPSKNIVFNERLKDDDGLLVNHLCKIGLVSSKEDALIQINKFVSEIHQVLNSGKEYRLNNIGSFRLSISKKLIFIFSSEINYLPETFGLTRVTSVPIQRELIEKRRKEVPVVNRTVEVVEKKMPYAVKLTTVFALPLIVIIMWGSFNKRLINDISLNYSGLLSSIVQSGNSYVPQSVKEEVVEDNIIEEENIKEDIIKSEVLDTEIKENQDLVVLKSEDSEPVIDIEPKKLAEVKNKNIIVHRKNPKKYIMHKVKEVKYNAENINKKIKNNRISKQKEYYIIGGAFSTKYSAEKFMKKIQKNGFNPIIIECKSKGIYRVSYTKPSFSLENTKRLKNKIKIENNPDAWLLVL